MLVKRRGGKGKMMKESGSLMNARNSVCVLIWNKKKKLTKFGWYSIVVSTTHFD